MKNAIARALVCVGVLAGCISATQTFGHVTDEDYQVTNLPVEESTYERTVSHSNYHAFREGLMAFTLLGCFVYLSFVPGLSRPAWRVSIALAGAYTLSWWLPWPLFGLRAPHLTAEIVHGIATVSLLAGFALLRPTDEH